MTETPNKLSLRNFYTALCVIVFGAFVIGFASYKFFENTPQNNASVDIVNHKSSTQNSTGIPSHSSPTKVQSGHNLTDLDQFANHFERTTHLFDLLARANVFALETYLVQSKEISDHHFRKQVQTKIFQRLSALEPKIALSLLEHQTFSVERSTLLRMIFEEWSLVNLQEAVSHAQSLGNESKETIVADMVLLRDDLSINERRDIARQVGCEWVAINILSNDPEQSIFQDPRQEWYKFVENNRGNFSNLNESQTEALGHILLAWVALDGIEILDAVRTSLPSRLSLLETFTFVTDRMLADEPRLALDLALELATTPDQGHEFRHLARNIAERWAELEPRSVFDATLSIGSRSLRLMLQESVVNKWAKQDPEALLDLVDTLPADLQILVRQHALIAIAATSPESAVSMLSTFSIRKNRDVVAKSIVRHWARTDTSKLFEWIDSDNNVSHIENELKRVAFLELTRLDPKSAMQEAASRPADDRGKGWEARVVTQLVILGEVDTAVELLPQVRAGITRVSAYRSVIKHLIEEKYNNKLAAELFLQLNRSEVTKLSYFVDDLTRLTPKNLYESLDKIHPKQMRLYVASSLISNNFQNGVFTEDELKTLEAIIESNE